MSDHFSRFQPPPVIFLVCNTFAANGSPENKLGVPFAPIETEARAEVPSDPMLIGLFPSGGHCANVFIHYFFIAKFSSDRSKCLTCMRKFDVISRCSFAMSRADIDSFQKKCKCFALTKKQNVISEELIINFKRENRKSTFKDVYF